MFYITIRTYITTDLDYHIRIKVNIINVLFRFYIKTIAISQSNNH